LGKTPTAFLFPYARIVGRTRCTITVRMVQTDPRRNRLPESPPARPRTNDNINNAENSPIVILLSHPIIIIFIIIIVILIFLLLSDTAFTNNYPLPPRQSRENISPTCFTCPFNGRRRPLSNGIFHCTEYCAVRGAYRGGCGVVHNYGSRGWGEVAYLIFIVLHDNRVQRASDTTTHSRCSVK